jgi:hypothetical protein
MKTWSELSGQALLLQPVKNKAYEWIQRSEAVSEGISKCHVDISNF